MVDILKSKLQQYPRLVSEITNQGGSEWLLKATHQPTNKNTVWETGGKNWFIKALNEAYSVVDKSTSVKEGIEISNSNYTKETPNDKSKGFFFTENLQAYLANRNRLSEEKSLPQIPVTLNVTANNNQAGIRTTATGMRNENAFAIIY